MNNGTVRITARNHKSDTVHKRRIILAVNLKGVILAGVSCLGSCDTPTANMTLLVGFEYILLDRADNRKHG